MYGKIHHRAVLIESFLCTVAVVDIPVNDKHFFQSLLLCMPGRDSYIVEQAKTHTPVRLGMMSGRAYQCEYAIHPVHHCINC